MQIVNSPSVSSATSAAAAPQGDALNAIVLKKALDSQASTAASLLQALPSVPKLATSGNLGTQLNTFA